MTTKPTTTSIRSELVQHRRSAAIRGGEREWRAGVPGADQAPAPGQLVSTKSGSRLPAPAARARAARHPARRIGTA